MVRHVEKHGGVGLSWLASRLRKTEIYNHERTSIDMRCIVTCLHLSGTHDQLNSPRLSSTETVVQKFAQIVETYSGVGRFRQ